MVVDAHRAEWPTRRMVRSGQPWEPRGRDVGPILDEVPYPAGFLVSRAVTDGMSLEVIVRPGGAGGNHRCEFARLRPGRRYTLTVNRAT